MEISDIIKKFSVLGMDELIEEKRISHHRQVNFMEETIFDEVTQLKMIEEMLLQEVCALWVSVLKSKDFADSVDRIQGLQLRINKKRQELKV